MKKLYGIILCILCCILSAGCSQNTESDEVQHFDIESESTPFYDAKVDLGQTASLLGTQFYKGEPIQLWTGGSADKDIYLYRVDGSKELVQKMFIRLNKAYLDQEGNLYYWDIQSIQKFTPDGHQVFNQNLSGMGISSLNQLCQTSDGKMFLIYRDNARNQAMGQINLDTGDVTKINSTNVEYPDAIGVWDTDLLVIDDALGIWEIDAETGAEKEILSFIGTTYMKEQYATLLGVQILEEGKAQLLWEDRVETLRLVEAPKDKDILVLRGKYIQHNTWLKEQVAAFNKSSDTSYIVIEESTTMENAAQQTSIEFAAGKGPDIIFGDVLEDFAYGILDKGGFEDLAPYLAASGLRKEDYFPSTFERWKDGEKLYSAIVRMNVCTYYIDNAVLKNFGDAKRPDTILSLVNALLAWKKPAFFLGGYDSQDLLDWFLGGSESLWGMINWEEGTCDFSSDLFGKVLEVSKRYGYNRSKDYSNLVNPEFFTPFHFLSNDVLEQEGQVNIKFFFDDGCYAQNMVYDYFAINANSAHKEEAWKFIQGLLSVESQLSLGTSLPPVNREAFDIRMAKELQEGRRKYDANGIQRAEIGYYDMTEEQVAEMKENFEEARFVPSRTNSILNIIHEEAEDYFNGSKGIEEISRIIQNKVQLYLNEKGK